MFSCLGHFRETLDGKHVHSLKTQIAPIMIELHQAAQNGKLKPNPSKL